LAVASLILLGGCVAQIKETRLDGAARPAPGARSEVVTERRGGTAGADECRDVAVTTSMIRDVEIRRSFADGAQETNFAIAMLLGGGIGLLAYGQDHVQCPQQGGGCSDPTNAAYVLLGASAIPLAMLAYNALAVRDAHLVERVAPEASPGPWRGCRE